MAKQLLTEKENPRPFKALRSKIVESEGKQVVSATGVFQNYLEENSNKRIYPKSIWDSVLAEGSDFRRRLQNREVLGLIEHPEDDETPLLEASHVITNLWFATPEEIAADPTNLREGDILGTYETMPYGNGHVVAGLLERKIGFGISSRGMGSTIMRDGKTIVENDFELETFDVVQSPSVKRARPKKVVESDGKPEPKGKGLNESETTPEPEPIPPTPPAPLTEGEGFPGFDFEVQDGDELRDFLEALGATTEDGLNYSLGEYTVVLQQDYSTDGSVVTGTTYILYNGGTIVKQTNSPSEMADAVSGLQESFLKESINPAILYKARCLRSRRKEKRTKPSTTPPAMKIQDLRSNVSSLTETDLKSIKGATAKANLIERIQTLRSEASNLVESDRSTRFEVERLTKRLNEFQDDMDELDTAPPEASPEEAAADEIGFDDVDLPAEAVEAVETAIEVLNTVEDDPEAAAAAEELQGLVDCNGGDCDDDSEFVNDIKVVESKKKAIARIKQTRVLESMHRATLITSNRLLKRNKTLKESVKSLKRGSLSERERKANREYKEAAIELAEMYNRDMIALHANLLESKNPALAESLRRKDFKVYRLFKEAAAGSTATAPKPYRAGSSITESDKTKGGQPKEGAILNESFRMRRRK